MREREREALTHYDVQLQRRAADLDAWNQQRKVIAHGRDLRLRYSPARNASLGTLVGLGGLVPSRAVDLSIIELAPGARTSTHRHQHSAELFVLEGQGYTIVNDRRANWERWDALYTPAGAWHYHVNTGHTPARFVAVSDAPLMDLLNLSFVEDIGQQEPRGPFYPDTPLQRLAERSRGEASDYERAILHAADNERRLAQGTLVTHFREQTPRVNRKGTKSCFLVDRALGYHDNGLSMVWFQIAPGGWQARHRHGGEAILYVVEGRGYSVIDETRHDWADGDAILVGQWCWHQHFNADPDHVATVIRMHMWESLNKLMAFCLWPLAVYEEPARLDGNPASVWEKHRVQA